MPRHGQWKPLNPDLPNARRELALCVRSLVDAAGLPLRKIERPARVSRSVLSALANGGQARPSADTLIPLLDYALGRRGQDAVLPGRETLERLCREVWLETDELTPREADLTKLVSTAAPIGPAPSTSGAGALVGGTGTTVAPVNAPQVDRRAATGAPDILWPSFRDLFIYLRSPLHERDAAIMMTHVGAEASAEETATAIASCRFAGTDEAADTILRHASRRKSEEVLSVAASLMALRQLEDAQLLVAYSTECA